jgi:L-serine/L-threonine ammonia-lyase
VFIHAYDDERLWKGHSSMIHEIKEQLDGEVPRAIVCAVGGGGMLGGLIVGCNDVGWGKGCELLPILPL